jgi:aminopeptidase N
VASVIAHELAHQWFGNLVTMKWWTDLWLNEGFATYVASLGVDFIHPEWNSLEEESVDNTLSIFKFDSLKSSHPVSVTIGHPNQISQIFDSISYDKGSTILRMMHLFLGEKSFQDGVSAYLKKHRYGNAEQDDLWEALTTAAHANKALPESITVKDIMSSWTLQTGYPIVTVTRDYDQKTAELTEMRYLADRNRGREDVDVCWFVPLSYSDGHLLDFNATNVSVFLFSCKFPN